MQNKEKVTWNVNPYLWQKQQKEAIKIVVERAIVKPKTEREIYWQCIVIPNLKVNVKR